MIRARGAGIDVPVWVQREVPYSVFISFLLVSRHKLFDMFSTRTKVDTFALLMCPLISKRFKGICFLKFFKTGHSITRKLYHLYEHFSCVLASSRLI